MSACAEQIRLRCLVSAGEPDSPPVELLRDIERRWDTTYLQQLRDVQDPEIASTTPLH